MTTTVVDGYSNVLFFEKKGANGFGDGNNPIPHFADTGLDAALKERGITHTIIMGFHVDCCVAFTAGVHKHVNYDGKGALHRGYVVLTAGDILKSSRSFPAKDRCYWKNIEGVIYFATAGNSLKLKEAHDSHNHSSFFTSLESKVKDMLDSDKNMDQGLSH